MKPKLYFGILPFALFISGCGTLNAQYPSPAWAWAKSLHATRAIYGHAITIDPNGSGDIYVAGGFEGTTDFDPGPDTFNLYSGLSDGVANFVSKYDGAGNFVWATAMPGIDGGDGSPYSIAIDPSGGGAIYIAGRFRGTIVFDPGPLAFYLTSLGNNDIFISKLGSDGNFVWAKAIGGPGQDFGVSLAFDSGGDGSVYTTGQFQGTVDFDPGNGTYNLTSKGSYDIFISKLNSSGEFQWAKTMGWVGSDVGRAIAFDPEGMGKVYTTGQFYKTVDFDPGDSTFNLTAAVNQDNFISILDGSGNFLGAKQMGSVNPAIPDRLGSIALDPAGNGEVYVTGQFQGTGDFDPGDYTFDLTSAGDTDVFISKLSDSCQFIWAGAIGGPVQDFGRDIAIQPGGSGNIFTMGMFNGTADFDPGTDSVELTSGGGSNIFISKLDSSGHFQWAKSIKGENNYGDDMVVDNDFLYLTGAFFGPSISFDSFTLVNNNTSGTGADLFIAKLDITSLTHGQIYVKQNATGNNDGTSWYNAFTKLQPALDQADNGDQLWIAAGTYIPEGPSADSSHFLLKKGVQIYGGFNGTESTLSERKLWTDTTTLSGDILGNDLPSDSSTDRSDNAHHILILDCGGNETIIDGLVFKGGSTLLWDYDNDSTDIPGYNRGYGGALYIRNTPAKIRNCLFRDNYGFSGSCLYSRGDSSNSNNLLIANSTFAQNRATFGAGIVLDFKNSVNGSHYEIDSCTFDSNISFGGGCGVIYSINNRLLLSTGTIRNSEFLYNHEGAVFSYGEKLLIENCKFKGNYQLYDYPKWAGGLWGFGNAIYFENYPGNITVRNTKFIDNYNEGYGGTVSIEGGVDALFENVLFYRNFGYHSLSSYGNIKLINSTWVDNEVGLALWFGLDDHAEIQNCIFDNEGDNLSAESWSSGSEYISKGGNISSDSTLASYLKGYNDYADLHQTNPLLDSDFVPLPGSPCIDAGNPEGAPSPYDLAGNPRIQGNGIDAGAFESPFMVAVKDAVWDSQVFSVFPNPVQDVLNFELESDWIGNIKLRVYNNQGQPVYNSEMNKSDRIQTFRENLNLLPPGEYVVLAIAGKTTYATKVIFLR